MFSKKILSILIAAVLLCAAIVGVVFIGADAGGTSYTWYIDGVGTAENSYATIDAAMSAAKAKTDWAADDTLTIYVTASGTTSTFNTASTGGNADTGRHLFNVITVFRADNTQLPITIDGDNPATDTVEQNTLLITEPVWTLSGMKSFAASNDYTFKNLDLSSWAATTYAFYAGSGEITFENVNFGSTQTMTISPSVGGWTPFKNWTQEQFDANEAADGSGLVETSIVLLNTDYGKTNGKLTCRTGDNGLSTNGNATGGGVNVKTNMFRNKIVVGEGSNVANINHHSADKINTLVFAPAESVIEVDGGSVGNLYSVRGAYVGVGNKIISNVKSGSVAIHRMGPNGAAGKFTGDVEVNWTGGTITEFWGAYLGTIDGDVTVSVEGVAPSFAEGKVIGSTVTGTVTQNIKDCDLQGEVYLGANGKAANVINNLSGTINTTDYYAYLGTNGQAITGNLTNNISCDWNYTGDKSEKHLFCGSFTGVVDGKITNNITTGADIAPMFYGGSRQANVGSIENNVSDGTFHLNFFGGNRESGTIGSVNTTISGGKFEAVSYLSDRGATSIETATVKISGGTFMSGVYLGSNIGDIGTLTSTVTGGTFKGKLYNSSSSGTITTKTLTIKPEGNTLSLLSAVEGGCTEFIGNSATVKIGSGTKIAAAKASGSVTFHQVSAWNAQTYFSAESGSIAITATQDKGVTGKTRINGNTLEGITEMLYGTSFVFNDRVSVTFHFLKTAVDATDPDSFSFVVKAEGGRTIANATLADIKASPVADKYYSYTTSPLMASEMAYFITYEGDGVPSGTLNLLDLAARGAQIATESKNEVLADLYLSYANYAVSVRNYLAKNAGGEIWTLPTEGTAPTAPEFTSGKGPLKLIDSPAITMYGRSLILDDGIRIRYYGKGPSTIASNYVLYVNNQKVENAFTYVSGETYPLRMEIPISVTEGETYLRITIKDANAKAHFDYVDRLDRLAADLGLVGETELANEALYYFQSAVAYQEDAKTKTVLTTPIPTEFSAGYSTVDATPYGVAATINGEKLGVDTSEPIHVTCVAMADGNAEDTVLYFSIPARKVSDSFVKNATAFLVEKTGVKAENIFFNATHSHSAPNITAPTGAGIQVWFNDYLYPAVVLSAQEALLDLTPSTAYSGNADSEIGVGIVRRYFNKDGDFCSIQGYYRDRATGTPGTYESDIDREMRTLRFEREGKKPILLINWQGHAASAVGYLLVDSDAAKVSSTDVDEAYISADFVYYLRQGLADEGYLAAFFNGGTGDINFADPPFTGTETWLSDYLTAAQIQEHKDRYDSYVDLMDTLGATEVENTLKGKKQVHVAYGKSLVQTALTATKSATKVNTGTIKTETIQEEVTVRKDPAQLVDSARLCKNFGSEEEGRMAYNMYGFDTGLEVTHTIKRNDTLGDTDEIPLSVVTFGDVALSFASYEMFHESASALRAVSPYKVNFVCGYTNGDDGYMPTIKGFGNEGYEHYACFYVEGTAEQCNDSLLAMLQEHKN